MQRIAWGRGFFRAWLALSVIWIGVCVYLIEPKTYRSLWRSVYEVKLKDGSVAEFDLFKSRTELEAELDAFMQKSRPDVKIDERLKDRDEIFSDLNSSHQVRLNKAKEAWQFTLIPPGVLLGFGLCTFWIVRGFRPV